MLFVSAKSTSILICIVSVVSTFMVLCQMLEQNFLHSNIYYRTTNKRNHKIGKLCCLPILFFYRKSLFTISKVCDTIKSIYCEFVSQRKDKQVALKQLTTPWSESVTEKPWQEYPRPQFVRKSYVNLNGLWDYAITKNEYFPINYHGKILVPFSPESALSGVNRQLKPDEYLFYRRTFTLTKTFVKDIVLLNFGAVDCICDVFVNGKNVCHHVGGYNSFSADVTSALIDGENVLIIRVQDFTDTSYHTNGKQSSHRKGMWYTPQSGIWQTVWMESVPREYIQSVKIIPDYDNARVEILPTCSTLESVTCVVLDGGTEIAKADGKEKIVVQLPNDFKSWSPESPFLYNLKLITRRDEVMCYFGMRKFGYQRFGKYMRLTLNNQPIFHNGLLDQGYWPDGLYTAPNDQALIFDIQRMKDLGFNMLRKHIKVEPMRWYYHCDRLGMLVWQDMPSGGTKQHKWLTLVVPNIGIDKISDKNHALFSRKTKQSRERYWTEYKEMLHQLYNCVSIAMWVPFNEGWGQFDANQVAEFTKQFDSTRTIDHASGWHDQGGGDIKSMHVYFKSVHIKQDQKRVVCLTEYGGYVYKDMEHSFNPDHTYSYKTFDTQQKFNQGLKKLFQRDVIRMIPKGLSAAVYTQVSDVEDEVNGIYTYDRQVLKVDEDMLKDINNQIAQIKLD